MRRRYLLPALAILPVLLAALALYSCRRESDSPWTIERLKAALQAEGYEIAEYANIGDNIGGIYGCRDGTALDRLPLLFPAEFKAKAGRLRMARVGPLAKVIDPADTLADGYLLLQGWRIEGHPDELRRVVAIMQR